MILKMRSLALCGLMLLAALVIGCRTESPRPDPHEAAVRSEQELERRLIAPCCWRETLDVHSSPLATELRAELRRRFTAGESADRIEADLVKRYGSRIQAHLPESLGTWLVLAVALFGAVFLGFYARRRKQTAAPTRISVADEKISPTAKTDYEWQLDQDLLDE